MADDKPIIEQERDWVERVRPVFQPYFDAADEEDAFLDGDRYESNEDYNNRDRRLIQVRGRETEDAIQHDMAVWSLKPRNLQSRPIDKMGDQHTGEFMVALVQHEITRVDKDFEGELYKAVMASMEHRYGLVWFDWHPDCGQWGEIIFCEEDFRGYMWDPAYAPHHILNDRLMREKRIHVDIAREMYGAKWLEPDRTARTSRARTGQPLLRGSTNFGQEYDDDKVTLWQFWHKKDKTKKFRDKSDGKDMIIDPEDRYMACAGGSEDGCGYRSPRQSDIEEEMPEMIEQGCPTCGGNLERIDSLAEQEAIYAYPKGRRLVIMSPHQNSPDNGPIYDDRWPINRCRSYPGIFLPFKVRSGRLMGASKTSWGWDQQIASDQLVTMALHQAFSSQPLWVLPKAGLFDRDGRRFERRDDQGNTAFRDDSQQFMERTIERYDGGGIDPAWGAAYQAISGKLQVGRADLGLTEESSKDIAASTVAQITKQEELPTADLTKRFRRAVSQGIGVLADMITATYPPARLTRLNLEGVDQVLEVWGQDMPGFDFEIEDTPDFTGLEKDRKEALDALEAIVERGMAQMLPPAIIAEKVALYAEEMHFPPSTVRKYQAILQKMAEHVDEQRRLAEEQAAAQQGMMEDEAAADVEAGLEDGELMPAALAGMMEPGMEEGMNGGGMVPQPAV